MAGPLTALGDEGKALFAHSMQLAHDLARA